MRPVHCRNRSDAGRLWGNVRRSPGPDQYCKTPNQTVPADFKPTHSALYRRSTKARKFEKHEIDRILSEGVIQPARTELVASLVLAAKQNGSVRFFVNYWKLNDVKKWSVYPIPRADECIDSLGEAHSFRHLTWPIASGRSKSKKTIETEQPFTSHQERYCFMRLPVDSPSAPSTLQQRMDAALSTVKCLPALVYLHDIVVFPRLQ